MCKFNSVAITALAILLLSSCTKTYTGADYTYIRPPYLKAGDVVGIVSPAGKIAAESDTVKVRGRFEEWGLKVKFGRHFFNQDEPYFAGTDQQRAADIQDMIDDPQVKAIVAYRGGYGSVRLLNLVNFSKLRSSPKWIAGYSDVTMFHLELTRLGIESIHSTMPVSFKYDQEDSSAESLRAALFGKITTTTTPPHTLNQYGVATGRLIGGNLSLIYSASGTISDISLTEPYVLVMEDIGEYMYHIDRMMQNLSKSGKLDKMSAIIVGQFTDTKEAEKFGVSHAYEVISRYTKQLNIPVIYNFPLGHDDPNLAVYIGRQVDVLVDENGASIRYR